MKQETVTDSGASGVGATRKLACYAATLEYESLPPALVRLLKQCVLDTLGVAIGASTLAAEARIAADYVMDLGGKPESSILGFGGKVPAPSAAFVNGSLSHMLDFDNVSHAGHTSAATVPVAFAAAEKLGGASGRDLITAVACGTDLQYRLGLSIDIPDWTMAEGWAPTQLLGFISGAATAGRMMGLNEDSMENALGIGFNQMSGSRQMMAGAATHLRSMQAGFSGQGGMLAAELARRGIVGDKEILEGRYGLYSTYVRTRTPDWEALVGALGSRFSLIETHGFKAWPACGYTRPTNAAALRLRQEYGLRPDDIETVVIIGSSDGTEMLCEPIDLKRRPKTSVDGKFSIPFTTAVMMVKGNVTLRSYTDEGLRDPEVLAMADRITYRAVPGRKAAQAGTSAATVGSTALEVRTKDGRLLTCRPETVPGDPTNPLDPELLEAKFRDCTAFSARPVPPKNVDRVIEMIGDLENIPDATEIIRLL